MHTDRRTRAGDKESRSPALSGAFFMLVYLLEARLVVDRNRKEQRARSAPGGHSRIQAARRRRADAPSAVPVSAAPRAYCGSCGADGFETRSG